MSKVHGAAARDRVAAVLAAAGRRRGSRRPRSRVISGAGAVRCTDALTLSCGSSTPRWRRNSADQAPPASTTARQAIAPCSVTTPLPCRLRVRASGPRSSRGCWRPRASAARASAGTARAGSARASLGVNRAPLKRRLPWPQQRVGLGRRQQPRVELMVARVRQPGLEARELVLGLGEIGDAALGASRCPRRARARSAPTAAAPG